MAKKLQLRRGTTTQHNSFTGAEGEVTVDTTKDSLVVHDGSTQGGHPIAKSSDVAGFAALTGATFTGDVLIDNAQELRLGEADGSGTNFTGIKAQAQSGDITLTLPAVAPTANQVLKADASTPTTLTWASDVQLTLINSDTFSGASTSNVNSATGTKNYIDTQVATKQASDADLTAIAGLTSAADKGIQFTGSGTAGTYDLTAFAKTILDDADAAAVRTTIGAGTGSGDATLAGAQTFTGLKTFNLTVGPQTAVTHSSNGTYTCALGTTNNHKVTVSADCQIDFSGATNAGQSGIIEVVYSSGAITWSDKNYFAGGTSKAPTIAGTTILAYLVFDTNKVLIEGMSDVKNTA